jgi:hypothetical protein
MHIPAYAAYYILKKKVMVSPRLGDFYETRYVGHTIRCHLFATLLGVFKTNYIVCVPFSPHKITTLLPDGF